MPSARMVIAATTLGLPALELSHGLLRALWSEEQDVTQPEVRIAVADALGFPFFETMICLPAIVLKRPFPRASWPFST